VSAVGGDAEVYVDGGIRTGADVLAATSLGATGVFLGRLPLYALVGGADAVLALHHELGSELIEAMRLAGCRNLADAPGIAAKER
jgi:4-hydroxymandelate oxidase